jgi:16S rRNA (uracil1498-N3)-methyltransferase
MNSFYVPEISGNILQLSLEESKHCIKVLRLKKGDHVFLLNGKGSTFEAVIQFPDPKGCELEIINEVKSTFNRPYHLSIAIAPTKNMDRFEWFAEKTTEIGIDRIIPLVCQHSERRDFKSERLEKILVAAMKQSGQTYLPEITGKTNFKDLVSRPFNGIKLIAHCADGDKVTLKQSIIFGMDLLILIGPEGDFDPAEIHLALQNGFIPVSLGDSRLRTETAGLVACHTACLVNEK